MQDLVDRIKKECATAYFAAEDHAEIRREFKRKKFKTYGCDLKDSAMLFDLCGFPEKHYWRMNPFLPTAFKKVMHDSHGNKDNGWFPLEQLYVFHYKLDIRAMRKEALKIKDTNEWYNQRLRDVGHPEKQEEVFPAEAFMADFVNSFDPATIIYPYFTGIGRRVDVCIPHLIGRRELQEETMAFIKADSENYFHLLKELAASKKDMEWIQKHTHGVHVYDLLGKPREVHFPLQ